VLTAFRGSRPRCTSAATSWRTHWRGSGEPPGWAAHNVRAHQTGPKRLHHPIVGDLTLTFEVLELAADPGLEILAYTAEAGTTSHDALNLLGSWAATVDPATTPATNEA
jgi:MmyB-like transcription regulator ligand binding domain